MKYLDLHLEFYPPSQSAARIGLLLKVEGVAIIARF